MFTLVDFAWRKSEEFEYEDAPFGLNFTGVTGDPERFELYYELGLQLPFTELREDDSETFQLERAIGIVESRVPLSDRDRLIFGLDGEVSSKGLRPGDPASISREDSDVRNHRLRAEWWRSFTRGRELSLGVSWRRLREDAVLENDPDRNLSVSRDETLLYGAARLPIAGKWSTEPYLLGGPVQLEELSGDGTTSGDDDGFQGKLGAPFVFAFSDQARIRFDLSLDLDELKFGGAAVQFLARF